MAAWRSYDLPAHFAPGAMAAAPASQALGVRYFNIGEPCGRGHLANRLVNCGHCVACGFEQRRRWLERFPGGTEGMRPAQRDQDVRRRRRRREASIGKITERHAARKNGRQLGVGRCPSWFLGERYRIEEIYQPTGIVEDIEEGMEISDDDQQGKEMFRYAR